MTEPLTRLDTLRAIHNGEVTVKYVNDFKKYQYVPVHHSLNAGYLERAGLVDVEVTSYPRGDNGRVRYYLEVAVTEKGKGYLDSTREELACSSALAMSPR